MGRTVFTEPQCLYKGALYIGLHVKYGPGVDLASNRNEYQEHFLRVKAAGA